MLCYLHPAGCLSGRKGKLHGRWAFHASTLSPINESKGHPFNHGYDATDKLQQYKDMSIWLIEKIGVNDLVIMEVCAHQWKCNLSGKAHYSKEWSPYQVGLELCAVSMLAIGPDKEDIDDIVSGVEEEFTL